MPRLGLTLSDDPWRIPVIVPGGADAGVNRDGRAGDAGRDRRGDESYRRSDVARGEHAAERMALGIGAKHLVAVRQGRQPPLEERRQRDARADAIHAYLVAGEVERG